jgi:hypothetical protein
MSPLYTVGWMANTVQVMATYKSAVRPIERMITYSCWSVTPSTWGTQLLPGDLCNPVEYGVLCRRPHNSTPRRDDEYNNEQTAFVTPTHLQFIHNTLILVVFISPSSTLPNFANLRATCSGKTTPRSARLITLTAKLLLPPLPLCLNCYPLPAEPAQSPCNPQPMACRQI